MSVESRIVKLYEDGMSQREIAANMSVTRHKVRASLKKGGATRTMSEAVTTWHSRKK